MTDTRGVVEWLVDGARSAPQPEATMQQLCERLCACGVPLWRAAVFLRTLHPQVTGRRFLWQDGAAVHVGELPFEDLDTMMYRASPVATVYATGAPLRRRLDSERDAAEFGALRELYAEGATDYLASPLFFSDGSVQVATWATRHAEGFSPAHIAGIEAIVAPLARIAETQALKRTASDLLDIYVGNHAGGRILAGQIRRGDTDTIHAAIWLSDMRGFTRFAETLPPPQVVALLNRYFDCQVPAILERGGEVLKFMGDGLLAIFPVDGRGAAERVCATVLAAASEARRRVAALADSLDIAGIERVRFGLALHVGDVLYGNIGGGARLDFTCIGPAVNIAARLEKLAGRLGRAIVASDEFARHCTQALEPLGAFLLPGSAKERAVFGVAGEG